MKLSERLVNISTMLMVASKRNEVIHLASELNGVIESALEIERLNVALPQQKRIANGILKFSEKEICKMPKEFRKDFRVGNVAAHIRKKDNGVYEIRCQINKVPVRGAAKLLEKAKERFIESLREIVRIEPNRINKRVKLCDYMLEWLETVKKPAVKPVTYKDYLYSLNTHIRPAFDGRELASVKGFELQTFFNGFTDQEKHRTARKLFQLLSAMFDYAVMDEIITKSPLQKITLARYEEEHGTPLDRTEERALVERLAAAPNIYAQAYVFMLYTGLRRSELASVEMSDGWIKVISAKQQKGMKIKTRSFPISPMLSRVLPMIHVEEIKAVSPAMLTKHVKDFFPNHHAHDLRHTFITRCQECGIQRELVSLWAGHAADSSQTTLVYTHLEQNKDHQAAEMSKLDYPLF